ncbi:MAG TPA: hypothetical protein VIP08_10215 [Phenylobacterium sp.]
MKKSVQAELRSEFESEVALLAAAWDRYAPAEALMRVRALAEIAGPLTTEGLLELAVAVSTPARGSRQ